jgi:hypothetical protein
MEYGHGLRDGADKLHVVLDDYDGCEASEFVDDLSHAINVLRAHSSGGFIEQHEPRVGYRYNPQFDALAFAVG